jgi:dihydrofolate reductase
VGGGRQGQEEVMARIVADISMSLDGFVTGPDPGPEQGLGVGGEALHAWALDSEDPIDAEVLRQSTESTGAVVMGRRLFDVVDGPHGWSDAMGYGAGLAATPPFFVVTHAPPDQVRLDLPFSFVTTGLRAALDQAGRSAGDGEVVVMGGGDVVRQCVDEGLADELRIHLAPIVLGGGTSLFTGSRRRPLRQRRARVSSTATHLVYALEHRGRPHERA